jgi:hypothetical protein
MRLEGELAAALEGNRSMLSSKSEMEGTMLEGA